eukprot:g3553.t1
MEKNDEVGDVPPVSSVHEDLSLMDNIAVVVEKEKALVQLRLEQREAELQKERERLKKVSERCRMLEAALQNSNAGVGNQRGLAPSGVSIPLAQLSQLQKARQHLDVVMSAAPLSSDKGNAKSMRELVLARQPLQAAQLEALRKRLPLLPRVTRLDLSHTGLTDSAAVVISQLLDKSRRGAKIKSLDLSGNNLGKASAHMLARVLQTNSSILELDISHNPKLSLLQGVGDMFGRALRNNKHLQKFSATLLDTAPPHLEKGGSASGKSGSRKMKPGKYLGHTSKFLAATFLFNVTLRSLRLTGAKLTPKSVEAFGKSKHAPLKVLTEIDLTSSFIGPLGMFSLSNAMRTVKPASSLAVRRLILQKCALGEHGAAEIARIIRMIYTIEYIDVRGNFIGDDGACKLGAALQVVGKSSDLCVLDVGNNPIGGEGGEALVKGARLCISLTSIGTDTGSLPVATRRKLAGILEENASLKRNASRPLPDGPEAAGDGKEEKIVEAGRQNGGEKEVKKANLKKRKNKKQKEKQKENRSQADTGTGKEV